MIGFHITASSAVPTYMQLVEQVRQALRLGRLQPGDRLPTVRAVAAAVAINPNTVLKAYRELEHEGVIELRHGAGAFVSANARTKKATDTRAVQAIVAAAIEKLRSRGVTDEEIRRLFEAELAGLTQTGSPAVARSAKEGGGRG